MSIRKILVAGLAVVGIVGIASAQSGTPITLNSIKAPQTGTMDVSYTVELTAEMVVTPKPLSGVALFNDPTQNSSAGNLGSIVVRTNYPRWDIEVSARNALALCLPGTVTETPGGFPGSPPTVTNVPGAKLMASKTATDSARLDVHIGILNGSRTGYEGTTLTKFTDSLSKKTTGGAGVQVSFAKTIGDKLGTDQLSGGAGGGATVGPPATVGETGTAIKAAGFKTPSTEDVTFFVSAGLTDASGTKITKIQGANEEGIYTETLTFTMIAGF